MPPKKNQHDIAIPKGVPRWPGGGGKGCFPDAAGAEFHRQTEQSEAEPTSWILIRILKYL